MAHLVLQNRTAQPFRGEGPHTHSTLLTHSSSLHVKGLSVLYLPTYRV